ncbi:glycoside hydrolase superfamily [Aspergillus pseudotamarii]|uniref:Probable beta-glucosidase G n=1 Tax=Aspergillus pseudotamarii TaxID=132259 RepID=A0A5N6SC28_ASPPS|nr:glycoside hydrolase superfamily [Aspergillus pseudotamarii]KAE8130674.1 glycoside hydrolase superfamily [Aspergillus pseudotamarii]
MSFLVKTLIASAALLPTLAYTQANAGDAGARSPDAYQWIQPANTTILGEYGHSPPVYPSPNITGSGGWETALDKATHFVSLLTLDEKAWLVTGVAGPCIGNIGPILRLNFTGLCLQDGPNAVRPSDYVSVFPAGITIASSWDRDLIYERYHDLGLEYRGKGAQVALAPVGGPLGRTPYGGRNWEGFSPDPYLTGVAMESSVKGLQDAGVQATIKHWLLYEQESQRSPTIYPNGTLEFSVYSSNADDRTIHELYMWPFANAIRAEASAAMCSYNRVNGSYACQNSKLLNGLLKKELGFQGYVMSDWGGLHSGVASALAGMDMDQPGFIEPMTPLHNQTGLSSYFGWNITSAVRNGTLVETRLDDMIKRIMTPYYFLHQDQGFPATDPAMAYYNTQFSSNNYSMDSFVFGNKSRDVRQDHGIRIRRHAAESTVMLKNTNNALPLKAPASIAIFGSDAAPNTQGPFIRGPSEIGTLAVGGGSGNGRFTYLVSPLQALEERASQDNTLVQFWLKNTMMKDAEVESLWGASAPEACLVFLKTRATERLDREHLTVDQDGDAVVESVARRCSNTIVVTHAGGMTIMPWATNPNVSAILVAHYPGQESGHSIVDILYGAKTPSGKLPYTIPLKPESVNAPPTTNITTSGVDDWQSWYSEGLEIDYRYYNSHNIPVQYEFGFGLSYTNFSMDTDSVVVKPTKPEAHIRSHPEALATRPGGNPALWDILFEAQVTFRNTGTIPGATVAQLYLSFPPEVSEPPLQLRGFEKAELAPGESYTATFPLMRRDLSYWNVTQQEWLIPTGDFVLDAGFSSRDLHDSVTFRPVA